MIEFLTKEKSRVFTIPAGANFLDTFASTLAAEAGLSQNPEALADAIIYVPNRRSERTLAFALHKAAGGVACLLPSLRALGDLETDDPPPSAEAALADLPPILSPASRIGALTRLVMQYFDAIGAGMPAVSCLSAARELARLLDQAALSGDINWGDLAALVPQAELADHWHHSVEFLKIITEQWPAKLEEETAMDPYARRFAAAEAMAAHWQQHPPDAPVIVAGSTGATPASRLLMQSVQTLPQGFVVLPGLDTTLDGATLDEVRRTPSHPQYALSRTLNALNLETSDVRKWPSAEESAASDARRRLIHEALAPAEKTADWTIRLSELAAPETPAAFVARALSGLTVLEASDESEEAELAAILLRQSLDTPDRTAALVTPDAALARRVSTLLKRWDIDISPSSGLPLSQTDAGSLILIVSDWLLEPGHPVRLMALLQHPLCRLDRDRILVLDQYFLRGPRVWNTWSELVEYVEQAPTDIRFERLDGVDEKVDFVHELLRSLTSILESHPVNAEEPIDGESWFQTTAAVSEAIAVAGQPWVGENGSALTGLVRDLAELSAPLGRQAAHVWQELLCSEAASRMVQHGNIHPRVAIWGPLEARLQTADLLILAGLNEEVWPAQPPKDAFLPRVLRQKVGLSNPDERIGLAAHDFAQLATAPNVTLLSSKRRDDKPAVSSRWLWRLQTLTNSALQKTAEAAIQLSPEQTPRKWLSQLEFAPRLAQDYSAEPRPTPPLSARPTRFSATRVERLVRDPYAIYCESILRLQRLDRLNLPPDARVRGTAIHKALERFELEQSGSNPDALLEMVEHELLRGGTADAEIISLREQHRAVCQDYLAWQNARRSEAKGDSYTELSGSIQLEIGDRTFTLTGTADRIESSRMSGVSILDFKTGAPPSEKQVRSGLSPQMPILGLIAQAGGYSQLGAVSVDALTYVQFGTRFAVRDIGIAQPRAHLSAMDIEDIIRDASDGILSVLKTFDNPEHPYLSAPRPERVKYESDYVRLARRDEWTGLGTHD